MRVRTTQLLGTLLGGWLVLASGCGGGSQSSCTNQPQVTGQFDLQTYDSPAPAAKSYNGQITQILYHLDSAESGTLTIYGSGQAVGLSSTDQFAVAITGVAPKAGQTIKLSGQAMMLDEPGTTVSG